MTQKTLDLKFTGLWTATDPNSVPPPGAMEVADNVVLREAGVVEPRRGNTATAANPSGVIQRVFPWGGRLMTFANATLRDYSDATGWSSAYSGVFLPPDYPTAGAAVRSVSAEKTFFFTTNTGIWGLDGFGNTPLPAGIAAPPYLTFMTSPSGTTWLAAGATVAYRAVLCRYDANNQLIQSAPGPSLTVTNGPAAQTYAPGALAKNAHDTLVFATSAKPHGLSPGQSVTVILGGTETYFAAGTFTVFSVLSPLQFSYYDAVLNSTGSIQTSTQTNTIGIAACNVTVSGIYPSFVPGQFTFVQLYRTYSVPAGQVPSDEYFLVSEYTLQAGDNAFHTYTMPVDISADSAIGSVPLYTNPNTGQGEAAANVQPPMARDVCLLGDQVLYANTTESHTLELQLIGTSGLSNGSTVVITGSALGPRTFTAGPTENLVGGVFQLYTAGTPAQNIEATARSLCRVISKSMTGAGAQLGVVAYYASSVTDPPGKIVLQEQGVGDNAFVVQAGQDGQTCWVPDLSKASYTAVSDANRRPNRFWYSPSGMPWSVPSDNWDEAGAADKAILRVQQIRSTAFLFKEDGVYTVVFGGTAFLP